MVTYHNPEVATGQKAVRYPWPYVEGLTIAEAVNELAFIATGLYGKPIPKQNGSPLRLGALVPAAAPARYNRVREDGRSASGEGPAPAGSILPQR